MAKKKIAVIFPKDSEAVFNIHSRRTFGGATVQLFHLVREMSKNQDLDLYSLIPRYPVINFPYLEEFKLIQTYDEKDFFLKRYFSFYKAVKNLRPEIIIQRGLTLFSCLLAVYCKIFKIKFVFMFAHDREAEGRYQNSKKKCRIFLLLIRYAHQLIVQNEIEKNFLLKRFKNLGSKIFILKKGIEIKKDSASFQKKYASTWIGRCESWKRPEVFIQLAQEFPHEKFCMICTPVPHNRSFFKQIKEHAEALPNIEFYEFVQNQKIFDFISSSLCLTLTSDQEGDWPMVVLEALACGTPILSLSLDYGGLIKTYQAGIFCDHDFSKLVQGLHWFLNNPKERSLFSQKAFQYLKENHQAETNIQFLMNHF